MVTIPIEGKLKPLVRGERIADADDLDGTLVRELARMGNLVQFTYQDADGVERSLRFIGAERQSIDGVRRIAYIPADEEPAESHFLDAAKSAHSMTEALDVSGISGILGHKIALWYEADIPQADLFTPHDTVRNYIEILRRPDAAHRGRGGRVLPYHRQGNGCR